MEAYTGQIQLFAFDFAPRRWAICAGQILSTEKYPALFNLIGTKYGSKGAKTFALPDLRSRVPIGMGSGDDLSRAYNVGDTLGTEHTKLSVKNLPPHQHDIHGSNGLGNQQQPGGNVCADEGAGGFKLYSSTSDTKMQPTSITGVGDPFESFQPSLVMNYCICIQGGIYPPRD